MLSLIWARTRREFGSLSKQKNSRDTFWCSCYFGALKKIRTPDLLVRSQTLYPAELSAQLISQSIISHFFKKINTFF